MDNLNEIKNQRLFEELGLVDKMGGTLAQNRLKGNVKIHKIFPEIWRNNSDKNGNLIKKTVYENSKIMYDQKHDYEYYFNNISKLQYEI